MTPQDKYQKIMEVMSDKTLWKDCMLLVNDNWNRKDSISLQTIEELYDCDSWEEWICYRISTNKIDFECSKDIINVFDGKKMLRNSLDVSITIIWHPLHIGWVLDWIEKNKKIPKNSIEELFLSSDINKKLLAILKLWKDKRLPLSPTDEELIDYIYNLLP